MGAALEVVKSRIWETKQCDGPGSGTCVMEWDSGALQPERRAGILDVCGLLSWHLDLELGRKVRKDKMALGIILHAHVDVDKGDDANQKRGSGGMPGF